MGVTIASAFPAELTLADATLNTRVLPHRRNRKHLVGDCAYDSDPQREDLADRGIILVAPYRANRESHRYEDGR